MSHDAHTSWEEEVARIPLRDVIRGAYRTAQAYRWYQWGKRADYVWTYVWAWWRHRNLRRLKK